MTGISGPDIKVEQSYPAKRLTEDRAMSASQPPDREDFAAEPRSIDLREYWLIVRRHWVLILVATMLGAVAGLGYAKMTGKSYTATAQVVVAGLTQGPLNPPAQANLQVNMSTEQAVAESAPVIEQAAKTLGVQPSKLEAAAAKRLAVTVPGTSLTTSNVLQIAWKSGSAHYAQAGANAFADAYLAYRHRELASQIATLESVLTTQVASLDKQIARVTTELGNAPTVSPAHQNLSIKLNELTGQATTAANQLASLPTYNDSGGSVIAAALPTSPSGIGRSVILVIGALLGLLIGLVLAFVRDLFDDRLRDPGQLEGELGVATLAVLPPAEGKLGDSWDGARRLDTGLVTVASPDSRAAEAVRSLRVTLAAVAERKNLRSILVVGADGSVSSGRIAAELGVALAQSGRRVLLAAADMRGSPLPQIFGVPDDIGLSDLLVGVGDPEALTRHPEQAAGTSLPIAVVRRLALLPSGSQKAHAVSLLDSDAMIDLLQLQRNKYEFVLLDSPPVTVAADVFALAAHVDGVIVVAREARTSDRALGDLRRRLDQVGALLIGGVFIGKGRPSRHRHRSAAAQPGSSPPIAGAEGSTAEQAGNGVSPARRSEQAANGLSPARRAEQAGNGVSPTRRAEQAANGVPPATRPLPAIRDEKAAKTSGGRARPS
jgi:Mrp family chromosome partitioning ATPase/capsular polysaccharide biosynthesis protein